MCVNIMTMSIDLELAHKATIRPISTIAAKLGLNVEETIPFWPCLCCCLATVHNKSGSHICDSHSLKML